MASNISELEDRLKQAQSPQQRAVALNALAWELRYLELGRALELAHTAAELVQALDPTADETEHLLADSLCNLATLIGLEGDFEHAIPHALAAQALYEKYNDLAGQIKVCRALGYAHLQLANYPEALKVHLRALKLSQEIGDQEAEIFALVRMGAVYSHSEDYRMALDSYYRALPIARERGDELQEAIIYNSCSIEHRLLGEFNKSLEYARRALEMFQRLDNTYWKINALGQLGETLNHIGKYEEALVYLKERAEMTRSGEFRSQKVGTLLPLGRAYAGMGDDKKAVKLLTEGLELSLDLKMRDAAMQFALNLAEHYKKHSQFEKALGYFEQYHKLREQVIGEESAVRLQGIRIAYEAEAARKAAWFYRKQTEQIADLRDQDRQYFEKLAQIKDDFLRTASHNLKNPLTTILMILDLLSQGKALTDEDRQEHYHSLRQQAKRMQEVIVRLLDLARLETGRALQREVVDMDKFLSKTVKDFEMVARSKSITLEYASSASSMPMEIDQKQMHLALENLISNAIKYTPSGGLVKVSAEQGNDGLLIHVADNGLGIPAQDLPHIFEPFYRINSEAHMAAEGTGLGLAITRAIIEQHGGTIDVASLPGEGSTFTCHVALMTERPEQQIEAV